MAQRNAYILVERFTDQDLNRIDQFIDDEFTKVIETLVIASMDKYPVSAEVKTTPINHDADCDDEYRYLVVNDSIYAIAFIRRTDLNHYEMMFSSLY